MTSVVFLKLQKILAVAGVGQGKDKQYTPKIFYPRSRDGEKNFVTS